MIWIFMTLTGLAFTFTKLGAVTVMANVLSHLLGAALVAIVALAAALIWQRTRKTYHVDRLRIRLLVIFIAPSKQRCL